MTIYLPELDQYSLAFPSPVEALNEPNGLLAIGGDLRPERLLVAYQQGIFPWYGPNEPLLWWSPSPRAVFYPENFTPSRSLKKFYRKSNYKISINQCTAKVITLCGELRGTEEMWLNADMQKAYSKLSELGHCHSVEVWENDKLIGGLYGVQVGALFCGESMFSTQTNASKIALWAFCEHFRCHGGKLIDCQVLNPHTESLGAIELARTPFLQHIEKLKDQQVDANCYQPQWITISSQERA